MNKRKTALLLALTLIMNGAMNAEIVTEDVEYTHDDVTLQGYLAYDNAAEGPRPAVLIAHNYMGLQDYEKERARQLAELGFVAFAVDIYGADVRPDNRNDASAQSGKYKGDRPLLRGRMEAALEKVREFDERVDPQKIGVIGYCFGGTAALELARAGADVQAVVSFHGGLGSPTPEDAENIQAEILVCHGAVDPHVPDDELMAFKEEMNAAEVDYTIAIYSKAVHAFTEKEAGDDPSKGAAYNERAEKRSWAHMLTLFKETLGHPQ